MVIQMQLNFKKSALYSICLWAVIAVFSIVFILTLFVNKVAILTLLGMTVVFLAVISLSVFNFLNLISLYKQYVTIFNDIVTVNKGIILKIKSFPLSQISSVKYTRYNIIFKLNDEKPVKIDLYYVSTKERNRFVEYLSDCKVVIEQNSRL